jgi:two-component system, chemotaxis family, chemotaxis protein CheY
VNCPQRGSKQRATPRCAPAHRKCRISSLRILIVDDSDVTRRVLGTILRFRQWTVCGEAEDGWSGVKKFHELKPDLVLLDLAMPDMDGIEAARLMSGSDPTVPIILFTALDLQGLETRAYNAGICAVVSKARGWNLLKSIETAVTQSSRKVRCVRRYPSVATAQVQGATCVRSACVRDLSIAGAYLAMPNPFSKSASIRIKMSTENTQREFFQADATVAHSTYGLGMGVMFHAVSPPFLIVLQQWLSYAQKEITQHS